MIEQQLFVLFGETEGNMDNISRENFWSVLNGCHENTDECAKMIADASPTPNILCRFRKVTEDSLQQLQDNKLFFSSADHYDDPFDTYFYINVEQMIPIYNELRKELFEADSFFINMARQISLLINQNPDYFIRELSQTSIDFPMLKNQLCSVRELIQKRLFSICFCESPYNETLWIKYADNYKGFVQVYDFSDADTVLCGKADKCKNCTMSKNMPYIYPVYYSDDKYDATRYALYQVFIEKIAVKAPSVFSLVMECLKDSIVWEIEKISLIKKKCHENDEEWRMIFPPMMEWQPRPYIRMKPTKIITGLWMPEYEKRLVVSAAQVAGIKDIHELYINDADKLSSRPI